MAAPNKDSYRDNPLLKKIGVVVPFTEDQAKEYAKCQEDPVYFCKYIKIITLNKGITPFELYDFQERMIKTCHENRFTIMKCPRQVGKCLQLNTPIRLKNKSTGDIIETTIGEFYEQQRINKERKLLSKK
jgi:hypothetical protein